MKIDEYLDIVSQQIRYARIRPSVTEELKNHILDQAEAYEALGSSPKEALERAVLEMGDPVETGVSLDRIHRPQMNWGIVLLMGIISLFSIGVFYAANIKGADMYPWQRQAAFIAAGFSLMLLVYRMDYSVLGKFGWKPAVLFLGTMILGLSFFRVSIHGAARWISLGNLQFSVPETMLLYIPLFGAALYAFRGNGYEIFLKIIPLILIPTILVLRTPSISNAGILFVCLVCLFLFAVWKDWFRISKKLILGAIISGLVLMPFALFGYFFLFGEDYQRARLLAFFHPTELGDYIVNLAQTIRVSSSMIGSSEQSVSCLLNGPTSNFLTDYVLVTMCSIYGTLLTVCMVAGLLFLTIKIFKISIAQKNQLGMMIGIGCGLAFFMKIFASTLINLQILPYFSISMPFLSYGGSSTIVSYILLGLVLSVYRYKNISVIHKGISSPIVL